MNIDELKQENERLTVENRQLKEQLEPISRRAEALVRRIATLQGVVANINGATDSFGAELDDIQRVISEYIRETYGPYAGRPELTQADIEEIVRRLGLKEVKGRG